MGFAKYQEDNYSRYHGTSIVRRNEHDRFAPESDTNKSTNQGTQKKMNTSKLKDFTVAEARPSRLSSLPTSVAACRWMGRLRR
jgi:hypothetical protein